MIKKPKIIEEAEISIEDYPICPLSQSKNITEETEVSLLDYWQIIRKRWKLILAILLLSTFCTGIVTFLKPDIFEATVTLMPMEGSSSNLASFIPDSFRPMIDSSMLNGLGGKSNTQKLINILECRTLCEDVAKQLNLSTVFSEDPAVPIEWPDTIRELQGMLTVKDNRQGLVTISVLNTDPTLAANITNTYTSCLQKFLQENALSLAKKNRLFIEEQLRQYQKKLSDAEDKLKEFQIQKKIISVDAQSKAAIDAFAEIKAQVINKTVELGVAKSFATAINPEVIRLSEGLRELEKQLNIMEKKQKNLKSSSFPSLEEAPELGVAYMRLKRETTIVEKVYEMLTQQLILARIQEAREELSFQIIDEGIPPDKKIRPRRALSVLLAGVIGLLIGVFLAFFMESIKPTKEFS